MTINPSVLKRVTLNTVVAFFLFVPITGMLLNGLALEFSWYRPLILTLSVFIFSIGIELRSHYLPAISSITRPCVTYRNKRHLLIAVMLFIVGILLPFTLSKYWLSVCVLALIYVLLGLGLNIVVGLAGLLDLGFVAFYAVGAYGYALGHQYLDMSFWLAIPFGALLAACFGAVLGFPVLRMHGDYLAIVTLGFGEIIRLILNNWTTFTGGPNGVSVPLPQLFGLEFTRRAKEGGVPFHEYFSIEYSSAYRYIFIYLVLFMMVSLVIIAVNRLKKMPIGRAWEALREDEIACRSLGLNHVTVKLTAFSMGAMIGGLAGVFFAASQGFVNPTSFTFFESALILAIVVLGGLGSTTGVIVSAILLIVLSEVLREFSDYRMLIFGVLMVLMMRWRPRGLFRIHRNAYQIK